MQAIASCLLVLLGFASAQNTITFTYSLVGTTYTAVALNQRVFGLTDFHVNFVGTHLTGKVDGDVTQVVFSGGEIPEIVREVFVIFPNITQLTYSNTGLYILQPYAFSKATKLVTLTLTLNFLPIIYAHPFRGATSLTTINLTANRTHRIEYSPFVDLTSIILINLSNNRINHVDSHIFDGLSKLFQVDFTGNLCPSQKYQNVSTQLYVIQAAAKVCGFLG